MTNSRMPSDSSSKRRSKDMEWELSTFLPAEMSRREQRFHEAASSNDADAVRKLLAEGVGINCKNSLDRTALHCAAASGHLAVTEALLEGGADLEAKDKYGMRPVLWAAWFGHLDVLKLLVNAGACKYSTNKQGLGLVHCAATNNHLDIINFVFESLEPDNVNAAEKNNERTALHLAAEAGHLQVVDKLLSKGAQVAKKDKSGATAVHLAAEKGHGHVVRCLLLVGVEVDDRDVEGRTALHLAAEHGHQEAVDLMLDYNANPNSETIVSQREFTPLHLAAAEGHTEICRSSVRTGSNVNAQNFQGNTALHLAAAGNHREVALILVENEIEIDLPNQRLQTALHVAVEAGHVDVVQVLLAGGASLETREKSGKSALQLAARGNHVAIVDMLIRAQRFYGVTRAYLDMDVGYVDPELYLRKPAHPGAGPMREVLWRLATRQLKLGDWKLLAAHWNFAPDHIRAIEHEYTGPHSYREHGYRLLSIWLHGVRKDENVVKLLFEALVAIGRRQLAEQIRRRANRTAAEKGKTCSPSPMMCAVS
ncbi:ankyrin repeat and death domain-containing protein 1A-like isoform X1 [Littorina saxatilis]|uniref:ankyrin repeat and death domain-containing protein 1A-like isoform X1 n=1 Tax=Littorina saxatilis TaxID=31220 RepID=UPI0038B6897F